MVYGDLYAVVNTLCDIWLLWLTGRLRKRETRFRRLLPAALPGGAYALLSLYIARWRLLCFLIGLLVCATMVRIAFPYDGIRPYLQTLSTFFLASLVAGGVCSALPAIAGKAHFPPLAATLVLASLLLFSMPCAYFADRRRQIRKNKRLVTLCFSCKGVRLQTTGLVDSGNLLTDPESGLPVIVLLPGVWEEGPSHCHRTIPLRTVSSAANVPCLLPDILTLDGAKRRAALAFACPPDRGSAIAQDEYGALVPEALLLSAQTKTKRKKTSDR